VTGAENSIGVQILRELENEREDIAESLGSQPEWTEKDGRYQIWERFNVSSLTDPGQKKLAIEWLRKKINDYVNVFRPRIQRVSEHLNEGS